METLAQWIAAWVARLVESGSGIGALCGAVLGVAAVGVGGYLVATELGWVREFTVAITFSGGTLGGLVGTVVGSRLGPKRSEKDATKSEHRRVRLNRYNRGLLPLGFMVIPILLVGLPVAINGGIPSPKDPEAMTFGEFMLIILGLELIGVGFLLTNLMYVEFGNGEIVFGRLLTKRAIPISRIEWFKYNDDRGDNDDRDESEALSYPAGGALLRFRVECSERVHRVEIKPHELERSIWWIHESLVLHERFSVTTS